MNKPFYTLDTQELFEKLQTGLNGLSSEEVAERLELYGKNVLQEGKKKSLLVRFIDQLKDVMIIMLLIAAAISAIIAVLETKYTDLIDSTIILLIVIINAIIGLVQENKAENSLESLKNLNKPFAKVVRDGIVCKIKSEDIVPGDLVILEAGDIIPADLRLIESVSLKVEEAALTGESVPSEKNIDIINAADTPLGDRYNMCYSSGVIKYGRGKGIVVATGMDTEVGKIAQMLQEDADIITPLQAQLSKTAKTLSIIVLAIAAIIFAVSIARGFSNEGKISMEYISQAFMVAVAIAVAAIPEGLPAVVTIVLAISVQRMSEKKAIVRNLPAVETLGCCDNICSDKTGTLTLNQMTVKELFTLANGLYKVGEEAGDISHDTLVKVMVLCNDAKKEGQCLLGDPTETALIAYAAGIGVEDLSALYPRLDENPFDSARKLMSTINVDTDGNKIGYIKGAPDILINKCSRILDKDGVRSITAKDVDIIKEANHAMATKALRVLGLAIKPENVDKQTLEDDMVFVGLVGMIDPPRPEVKDAVATCKTAGMRAIMITGDHVDTAKAIAEEIGILEKDGLVITGAELDELNDEEFSKNLDKYCIFARVSPENKVRIVKAYKAAGKKVAMTGDGVNDAPSIKAADIGIGMGITGTDVSKGASDMVLADDNFATIVTAVAEGRKAYSNIQKAVQYLLSANIAEVLCLFIATVFLNQVFLTPVMILWVNLVTDSLPALALGTEKAELDIMSHPPRKSGDSLLAGKTGKNIIIQGLLQTILVMASFCIGTYVLDDGINDHNVAMTMAFITLCMIQLFHSYNMRSQKQSLFKANPFSNKLLNLAFIVCAILLFAVILIPGVGPTLFDTAESLTWDEWLIALGLSVLIIPMVEAQKGIERLIDGKKKARTINNGI